MRRYVQLFALLLGILIGANAVAEDPFKPTYWTLKLKPHDEIPLAQVAMVGGETFPDEYGVSFQLPTLSAKQPVDLFVHSLEGNPLTIIAFKSEPHEPLLEATTGGDNTATLSFRANGPIYFRLSGITGSHYQLILVVGPELEVGSGGDFIPMSQATITGNASDKTEASAPASTAADKEEKSGLSSLIVILLVLILVALGVIAFALLRGKRGAAALLGCLVIPMAGTPLDSEAAPPLGSTREYQQRIGPHLVDRSSTQSEGRGFILGAQDRYNGVKQFHGTAGQIIGASQALANFLKKYVFMDPNDAAVQPNYNPRGVPSLPASILDDVRAPGTRMIEYRSIADKIEKARRHLEGNYVVKKETELEAGMINELASAAAGLSPFAQLAWTTMKANPKTSFNVSAANFYKKYDAGQESGLNYLNDALKEMGAFEAKYYGYQNWYVYHGLPFHQFMSMRYIRPEN